MAETYEEAKRKLTDALFKNIQRGSETAANLDKALLSLSSGGLVFSMTFVNTLAPARLALPILFLAWTAFALSIVFVITGMKSLQSGLAKTFGKIMEQIAAVENAEKMKAGYHANTTSIRYPKVEALNRLALISFMAALLFLGVFVGYNLWI